jgi:uncharacterized protein (DUF427 family)
MVKAAQSGLLRSVDSTDGSAHFGYRIVVEPCARRIRAMFNGETIADSTRAVIMRESRLRPTFFQGERVLLDRYGWSEVGRKRRLEL